MMPLIVHYVELISLLNKGTGHVNHGLSEKDRSIDVYGQTKKCLKIHT